MENKVSGVHELRLIVSCKRVEVAVCAIAKHSVLHIWSLTIHRNKLKLTLAPIALEPTYIQFSTLQDDGVPITMMSGPKQ